MQPPTFEDIVAACEFIQPYLPETPLVRSEKLSQELGCEFYLKLEAATGVTSCWSSVPTRFTSNVDGAIAQLRTGTMDATGFVEDIGVPSRAVAVPTIGMSVAKSGRTTGFTTCAISSMNTSVSVQYQQGCGGGKKFNVSYTGQIVIGPGTFSVGGDSGSLIVTTPLTIQSACCSRAAAVQPSRPGCAGVGATSEDEVEPAIVVYVDRTAPGRPQFAPSLNGVAVRVVVTDLAVFTSRNSVGLASRSAIKSRHATACKPAGFADAGKASQ